MYTLGRVFLIFLIHKIWVTAASFYFVSLLHKTYTWSSYIKASLISNFAKWDSVWYIGIAAHGYNKISAAFFPLYPLAIRFGSDWLGISYRVTGLLISNICLFVALYFFVRLIELDFKKDVSWRASLFLVLFPTAYYLSAVYTEAMFLMWIIGCLYFARQGRWIRASLFGMFAALTRNTGILMILPVAYEYMAHIRWNGQRIRLHGAALALIPMGLGLYMGYLQIHLGDAIAFVHAQKSWHREFRFPWITWMEGTHSLLTTKKKGWPLIHRGIEWLFATAEIIGTLSSALLRLRGSYLIYLIPAVLIPFLSPNVTGGHYFYSVPRFFLTAFPLFLAAAILFSRQMYFLLALLLSSLGQLYLMYHFTVGHFVS